MKRKGFTLVELLVVIAIIALLMGILVPALSRTRQLAFRLTCGTNLSGIGKAMMVYAHDYDGKLPRAGGSQSTWGPVGLWSAPDRRRAFGLALVDHVDTDSLVPCNCNTRAFGGRNGASISSCFYLLVKYADVTPKSYVCKGDIGTSEFSLADLPAGTVSGDFELADAWDFGPAAEAVKHCSYAYHMPFGMYGLTVSSEPGFAVAADRNPWLKSPAGDPINFTEFRPDLQGTSGGTSETAKKGNAVAHQLEGQNVMFLDTHVEFEKRAYCSMEDDNIYTLSKNPGKGDPWGSAPTVLPTLAPANRKDSLMVHDTDAPPKPRCFVAGTPVWVGGRLVPIAGARAGQVVGTPLVNAMALHCNPWVIERVETHEGVYDDVYTVVLENGESLCVSGSHVFLLDCGTWARLEDLQAGTVLRTHAGPMRVLASIHQTQPFVGVVYNLKIKDANHYFVGVAGVVVRDY